MATAKRVALLLSALLATVCAPAGADEPRVAVWDPVTGTKETRFAIDANQYDFCVNALKQAGIAPSRVTADGINDPATFSAGRFDVLVLRGDAFPRMNTQALRKFGDEGGILLALSARVPFLVAIEPEKDGTWTMSPKEPKFAWQSDDIYGYFGIKYIYSPGMHDQGMVHTATPLLKKYLPDAPDIRRKMPAGWIVPVGDGEFFPLLRSRRLDGKDVSPQIYIARSGKRMTIVCVSEVYTGQADPKLWSLGKETVVALVRLAKDLRDGAVKPTAEMKIDLPETLPPPEPLQTRQPTGGVEPEHAAPVVRWGRFDGSSAELGPVLPAGKTAEVRLGADSNQFPRGLAEGASVKLAGPAMPASPAYLRVRGAFAATGGVLKVSLGNLIVHNEVLNYLDAGGAGNFQAVDLKDVPAEFTRIIFLPPGPGGTLTLANPGKQTVYFDAVQVEQPAEPARQMLIGLNQGFTMSYPGGKNTIPPTISSRWSAVRCGIRSQFIGPPEDPNRWARIDEHMRKYLTLGAPIQLLFEGTPAWAAISPERYKLGVEAKRPHTVPPDPDKYAAIVEEVLKRYGDKIDAYEVWNEANIQQFWRGSVEEYVKLFLTVVPVIRKLDPTAKIIAGGMAGLHEHFVAAMTSSGALGMADLVGLHPYAGKGPGWDVVYGQMEGELFSRGIDKEIFCNESGFPYLNAEWFQPPPNFTPQVQYELLDKAIARLMANGPAKLSVFHAGGDKHPYGLIDETGTPRPAYSALADYLPLGARGGRRLDISMVSPDGAALQGVYAAAATHEDGSVTVVVNPSEVERLRPRAPAVNPSDEFDKLEGWTTFFGKSALSGGKVTLTVADGKQYVGFYKAATLDPARWPIVEVRVSECEKTFQLIVKIGADQTAVLKDLPAGVHRVDLRQALKLDGPTDAEVKFAAAGKTVVDYIRFLPDGSGAAVRETPAAGPAPLPVLLRIPLAGAGAVKGTVRVGEQTSPVDVQVKSAGGANWAEVRLDLTGRSVLSLAP